MNKPVLVVKEGTKDQDVIYDYTRISVRPAYDAKGYEVRIYTGTGNSYIVAGTYDTIEKAVKVVSDINDTNINTHINRFSIPSH